MEHLINIEKHPNWYHDIPIMNTLILGSFPPAEHKRDFPFYYPNKQNNFWKILASLAKNELKYFQGNNAVLERKRIMEKLNVGVENMGKDFGGQLRLRGVRGTALSFFFADIVHVAAE